MLFCFLSASAIILIFCSYFCCLQHLVYLYVCLHKDKEYFLRTCKSSISTFISFHTFHKELWKKFSLTYIPFQCYRRISPSKKYLNFWKKTQLINFFDQDRYPQCNLLPILCSFCLTC